MRPATKKRPKRRTKPSLLARFGRYWILATVVALVAAAGGWWLATLPAFRLHELAITGTARVQRSEVAARAAIDPRANVWFLDRRAIERRIEAIPYVDFATVRARPLGNVWIEVTERHPAACVRDLDEREVLVDEHLRVLETGCPPDPSGATVRYDVRARIDARPGAFVRDPELVALQTDGRALSADGSRYRSFAHDTYGELDAVLRNGIEIRFGDDDDLERKQRLIDPILAELGPRAGDVRSVDVRAPAMPVVEYRK